jgi:S-adenosylmethionine:tRNA ribosyltransferase-isomerase
MKTSDFNFDLPESLIAQYPPESRGQSRLMVLDRQTGKRTHRMVDDLPDILCQSEFRGTDGGLPLLVFNNSKVRKARLIGKSLQTGATVEFLLLEKIAHNDPRPPIPDPRSPVPSPQSPIPSPHSPLWKAMAQHAKRRKPGSQYAFFDAGGTEVAQAEITGEEGQFRLLAFDRDIDDAWLDRYGHIPLPPYIKRQDEQADAERYQTVYAAVSGSAAAPTAGLHFTDGLLARLAAAGIETAFLTLHVGLGTFLPVRSENIEDHLMHRESFSIDEQTATHIETAKVQGRKVVAVGTTSVRTLESAWEAGRLKRGEGSTSIFIYPGYHFNVIDAMFTNFHTPESTLLMLVSAFAGRESILACYAEAVSEGYRFFSYGDAMLIV